MSWVSGTSSLVTTTSIPQPWVASLASQARKKENNLSRYGRSGCDSSTNTIARFRATYSLLLGVESFSEEGLKSAGKQWNPVGQKMVETIQQIQDKGISVLSSIICGLESDTVHTIQTMRKFATQSGTILAQFTFYSPYPGTKDFYEMMNDKKHFARASFVPKHKTQIREERFWLKPLKQADLINHANISRDDLLAENKKCWDAFYSLKEIFRRTRRGRAKAWPLAAKFTYLLLCLSFKRIYTGHGVSADSVQKKMGFITKVIIKSEIGIYNYLFRWDRVGLGLKVSIRHP